MCRFCAFRTGRTERTTSFPPEIRDHEEPRGKADEIHVDFALRVPFLRLAKRQKHLHHKSQGDGSLRDARHRHRLLCVHVLSAAADRAGTV